MYLYIPGHSSYFVSFTKYLPFVVIDIEGVLFIRIYKFHSHNYSVDAFFHERKCFFNRVFSSKKDMIYILQDYIYCYFGVPRCTST